MYEAVKNNRDNLPDLSWAVDEMVRMIDLNSAWYSVWGYLWIIIKDKMQDDDAPGFFSSTKSRQNDDDRFIAAPHQPKAIL